MTDNEPRPGARLDLELTDMAYGGDAVGRADDHVVFAWGGIQGEQVTVAVEQARRDILRGRVVDVAHPAPQRVAPPCPYFGPCGGCQWQHIAYPAQVDFKTHILREQLRRIGGLAPAVLDAAIQPALGMADPWHYRNSSTFQVDGPTQKLGYYRRESHDVVPIAACPISDPLINTILAALQARIDEYAQPEASLAERVDLSGPVPIAMRERTISGLLRVWQVTIRVAPGHAATAPPEVMIILHTQPVGGRPATGAERTRAGRGGRAPQAEPERSILHITRKALRRWAEDQPGRLTIVEAASDGRLEPVGISGEAGAALSEDASELTLRGVAGKRVAESGPPAPLAVLRQRLAGQPYWVAPTAFFQVNNPQAEVIVRQIAAALPQPVDLLVDAYCGVGTFALALLAQGRARRVVGIESDAAALASARWTSHLSHVSATKAEWVAGRVEDVLPGLKLAPDVVLLDPPRTGCARRLVDFLCAQPPPRLIYISCDPSTLARDLKDLSAIYTLRSAQVVDLFPQTFHIETVVVLDRI